MQFSITTEVDAPPEVVFAVLSEVERWPEWTPTVTRVERLGDAGAPLALGGRLRIVQPKVPPAEWTVTALEPGRGFRLFSRSPGATVEANHWAEPAGAGDRSRVSRSQRQRPAALTSPLEVAAQGLSLIGARHGADQQGLRSFLDARQAAELAEQVLVLHTQLAPRERRPLSAAVLAKVDEPAPGRRQPELQAVTLERDGREPAIGVAVRGAIGELGRVHAEHGGALAPVLEAGKCGKVADVVLH